MSDATSPAVEARSDGPDDLELRLPARPSASAEVRARLGAFLDAREVREEVCSNALLVGHELTTNAIAHGSCEHDQVDLRAKIRHDRLCIVVRDAAADRGRHPLRSPLTCGANAGAVYRSSSG